MPPAAPLVIASGAVNVLDYGAAGDGVTNDSAAIQRAMDSMKSGGTLVFPAGRVFAHDSVVRARVAGVRITGNGTLLATNQFSSSLMITADNVTVDHLSVRTKSTTQRLDRFEEQGITLLGAAGTTLSDIVVDGPAAAGIYLTGAEGFSFNRVTVNNSRADAIHITGGSRDGSLTDIAVSGSGDDGVAVVSLATDGAIVSNVTVINAAVRDQKWGRAFSIVGGTNITLRNIYSNRSSSASLYVAAEREYNTRPVTKVLVDGATLDEGNANTAIDHGAVMLYNSQGTQNSEITLKNFTIRNTRASASRQVSLIGANQSVILMQNFTITGGPGRLSGGDVPSTSYNNIGWTYNGTPVVDKIGW